MENISIYGVNRFEKVTKMREACRGIAVKNGKVLLSYEVYTDQWMIPGGGVEQGESYEACCIRELAEETGVLVKPLRHYLTINEYYKEYLYASYYFICKVTGQTERMLTRREKEVGMEPRWIPLEDAVSIFSRHQDYADNEEKRGMYLREYKALSAYLNTEEASCVGCSIIPYDEKYRDDMIFMVLEAKDALGRVPRMNEDLLDIQKNYLDTGDMFWLAVNRNDRVIGCIGYNSIPDTTEVKLHRLYVKAALKRNGIGTRLLHTAETYLREQGKTAAYVHLGGNEYFESYHFYPKHGYKEYADRMMKKEL